MFHYRTISLREIRAVLLLGGVLLLLATQQSLKAQHDLLPIDHPATETLLRLARAGVIPLFPIEHLPISRSEAFVWLTRAAAAPDIAPSMLAQLRWHQQALAIDVNAELPAVIIPTMTDSLQLFDDYDRSRAWAGIAFHDSATAGLVRLDPVLDVENRTDLTGKDGTAVVVQGGIRLRAGIGPVGLAATATNGTIVGDEAVVLADPRFGRSFKFGQIAINRDIDFGRGHLRVATTGFHAGVAREPVRLGIGDASTLLLGATLPSDIDWFRIGVSVGPLRYTHIHGALLDETTNGFAGAFSDIPSKYIAAHLLSVGGIGPVRLSVGESVIYGDRPIEIGYLNPLNFLKSQEHFLRDRDNSMLYGGLDIRPVAGLGFEGELLIDDLIFGNIGSRYWGNKTAWRVGLRTTGLGVETIDGLVEYSRLEPYVYSHFKQLNAYRHDNANLAASGLEPNSDRLSFRADWYPLPWLVARAGLAFIRHGANPIDAADSSVTRNVGGDVARGFDSLSATTVTFLDGRFESSEQVNLSIDAEVLRNVTLRLRLFFQRSTTTPDGQSAPEDPVDDAQVWFGLHIGSL